MTINHKNILEQGASVAQIGSPSEITENPASEFVASFIGVEKGKRELRAKRTDRGVVLVDPEGRTQGVLVGGLEDRVPVGED